MSDWFISGRKIVHSERSGWHTQKEKRKREERKKDRKKKSLSVNLVSGWLHRCCESRCVRGTRRGERWVCFCSQKSLVIPHQPPTMMKISFCVVFFFFLLFNVFVPFLFVWWLRHKKQNQKHSGWLWLRNPAADLHQRGSGRGGDGVTEKKQKKQLIGWQIKGSVVSKW